MNEYPNSIRNNMVNTTWPNDCIKINKEPDSKMSYNFQKEESHKFRNAIIAAAIAAAALGGVAGISYVQHQSMEQNTAVVATEMLPGGGQLNVTENPAYSYIVTPSGDKVASYNGVDAQSLASNYAQNNNTIGRHV